MPVVTDVKKSVKKQFELNGKIQPPKLYKVVYLNDDKTSADFVVETLVIVFDYDRSRAMDITQDIHVSGSAVVAVLPYEIAETKGIEVTALARSHGFPLQVRLVPEDD